MNEKCSLERFKTLSEIISNSDTSIYKEKNKFPLGKLYSVSYGKYKFL